VVRLFEAKREVVLLRGRCVAVERSSATTVSPMQYRKRLRLEEARRLLLLDAASAEAVAYQVGYANASQFSREYARLFA
jgi:transcriptional regulator GlxA family with amidase domain